MSSYTSMHKNLNRVKVFVEGLEEILTKFSSYLSSDMSYSLKKMGEYVEGLLSRAPHQVDDPVSLCKQIDFSSAPGWRHYESKLVLGCEGVVKDIDFKNGDYIYAVAWNDIHKEKLFYHEAKYITGCKIPAVDPVEDSPAKKDMFPHKVDTYSEDLGAEIRDCLNCRCLFTGTTDLCKCCTYV